MFSFGSRWIAVRHIALSPYSSLRLRSRITHQSLPRPPLSRNINGPSHIARKDEDPVSGLERGPERPEHAVISTFDLFSIGVGPSSSHTVGPMRAGNIFINDLLVLGLLDKVKTLKISLYGSLAATGKGHHTPQAILLGLEGSDPETIDTGTIPSRYAAIQTNKTLLLGGKHRISYDMDRDMLWRWDQVLKTHPNGMRFSVFDENGDLLATNEYFSVGGGFVVNEKTKVDENLFYKGVDKSSVHGARLHQHVHVAGSSNVVGREAQSGGEQPPYPFKSGDSLLNLTRTHNVWLSFLVPHGPVIPYNIRDEPEPDTGTKSVYSLHHGTSGSIPSNHHSTC